jgi:serine O-acetyltransferase
MKHIIKSDLYRYGSQTSLLKGLKKPGFRYMYFKRLAESKKRFSLKGVLYGFIIRKLSYKYGFQIPINTKIGEGFFIGHFGTIVINVDAIIGKYCNIAHSVTIGRASRGRLKGSPTLGDYVWIGTGSVIVGNIKIGSNVLIAPNSFVNFDVPDNSVIIGNPGEIIKKDNPTNGYINNIIGE